MVLLDKTAERAAAGLANAGGAGDLNLPWPATSPTHKHEQQHAAGSRRAIIVLLSILFVWTVRSRLTAPSTEIESGNWSSPMSTVLDNPGPAHPFSPAARLAKINKGYNGSTFGFKSADLDEYATGLRKTFQGLGLDGTDEFTATAVQTQVDCFVNPECTAVETIPRRLFATARSVDPLPPNLQAWHEANRDHVLHAWNDSQVSDWISKTFRSTSPVVKTFQMVELDIVKWDLYRLLVLLTQGGTYTDSDTVPLQPISLWGRNAQGLTDSMLTLGAGAPARAPSLVVGVEWIGDRQRNELNPLYDRDAGIVQWTFSAARGHPVVLDAATQVVQHSERVAAGEYGEGARGDQNALPFDPRAPRAVLEWSGPAVLTNALARYLRTRWGVSLSEHTRHADPVQIGDVLILPVGSLQAKPLYEKGYDWIMGRGRGIWSDSEEYVRHYHTASWWQEKLRG